MAIYWLFGKFTGGGACRSGDLFCATGGVLLCDITCQFNTCECTQLPKLIRTGDERCPVAKGVSETSVVSIITPIIARMMPWRRRELICFAGVALSALDCLRIFAPGIITMRLSAAVLADIVAFKAL